jgi:hypothetical protein
LAVREQSGPNRPRDRISGKGATLKVCGVGVA